MCTTGAVPSTPTETAIIVAVPQAKAALAAVRRHLDPAASTEFPAHVTIVSPFLAPDRLTSSVLDVLAELIAETPRFELTFRRVGWFGDSLVYLAPEPADPIRELTATLWRRFPEAPP